MVAEKSEDIDVIGIADDELEASVQMFFVRKGRVVGRKGFVLDKVEELTPGKLVDRILEAVYGDEPITGYPKQVLVPYEADDVDTYEEWLSYMRESRVQIRVPQRGDKRALMETVEKNAGEQFTRHRMKRAADHNTRSRALTELQQVLGSARGAAADRVLRHGAPAGNRLCGFDGGARGRTPEQARIPSLQGARRGQRRLCGDGGGTDPPAPGLHRRARPPDR